MLRISSSCFRRAKGRRRTWVNVVAGRAFRLTRKVSFFHEISRSRPLSVCLNGSSSTHASVLLVSGMRPVRVCSSRVVNVAVNGQTSKT